MPNSAEITGLLKAWEAGDQDALHQLTAVIYDELRRRAKQHMRHERPGNTLQTTALVNEVYLRLVDVQGVDWKDRSHFFALSAQIMRRILVDAARGRAAKKRGGEVQRVAHSSAVNFDEVEDFASRRGAELIAVDDSLQLLKEVDERKAQVVELRFFAGFSVEETAGILGVSPQTVMRDWKLAKAWLTRELKKRS
jgi:RNA polymerase sigma factor (TIGR02999 family)